MTADGAFSTLSCACGEQVSHASPPFEGARAMDWSKVMLLDCFTIPVVMVVSRILMGARYTRLAPA